MPECDNCDAHITDDYVRVFSPPDMDTVRTCPNCPDIIRDGADVRDARSSRKGGTDPSKYDPDHPSQQGGDA